MKVRGEVWGGDRFGVGLPHGPRWITGSDLCFSIRSVLLVEEPAGEPLEERGVRGQGFWIEPGTERLDDGKGVVLSLLKTREGSSLSVAFSFVCFT